jgi:hypothetical protein
MQQLESRTQAELRNLSEKVEMLARAVATNQTSLLASGPEAPVAPVPVTREILDAARTQGHLSDLLDEIADNGLKVPAELADCIRAALGNSDPAIRAAAGRALSAVNPGVAQIYLPAAIENERNRFVASVLRGALRAATA